MRLRDESVEVFVRFAPHMMRRIGVRILSQPHKREILVDLILILVLAFALHTIWACIVPPWQAPDEPAHFAYVAHIVEHGELPYVAYTATLPPHSLEVQESWSNTFLRKISTVGAGGTPEYSVLPQANDYRAAREYQGPPAERRNGGGAEATSYPPVYYLLQAVPYWLFNDSALLSRLYAVRIGTAILGAAGCLFGYLAAYEITRKRSWAMALGLCLTFFPMLTFTTAGVNNDAAMELCAAILIWLTFRLIRQGSCSPRIGCAMGVTSAFAMLTKQTAAPVVVIAGIVLLWRYFPIGRNGKIVNATSFSRLVPYALGFLVTYAPYLILHYYLAAQAAAVGTDTNASLLSSLLDTRYSLEDYWVARVAAGGNYYIWLLNKSTWGLFGWLDVPMPDEAYAVISIVSIVGLSAAVAKAALHSASRPFILLLFGYLVTQSVFVFVVVDYFVSFAHTGSSLGLQGRYFFPALIPYLFLIIIGWSFLFQEHPRVVRAIPIGMATLQIVAFATLIAHYYGITLR